MKNIFLYLPLAFGLMAGSAIARENNKLQSECISGDCVQSKITPPYIEVTSPEGINSIDSALADIIDTKQSAELYDAYAKRLFDLYPSENHVLVLLGGQMLPVISAYLSHYFNENGLNFKDLVKVVPLVNFSGFAYGANQEDYETLIQSLGDLYGKIPVIVLPGNIMGSNEMDAGVAHRFSGRLLSAFKRIDEASPAPVFDVASRFWPSKEHIVEPGKHKIIFNELYCEDCNIQTYIDERFKTKRYSPEILRDKLQALASYSHNLPFLCGDFNSGTLSYKRAPINGKLPKMPLIDNPSKFEALSNYLLNLKSGEQSEQDSNDKEEL